MGKKKVYVIMIAPPVNKNELKQLIIRLSNIENKCQRKPFQSDDHGILERSNDN